MTRIKICGVTRAEDAEAVAALGVDFLGLNFWPRSKRYVSAAAAGPVAAAARAAGGIAVVGVFVDPSIAELAEIARAVGLDAVQLHGDETPAQVAQARAATGLPVWKAVPVAGAASIDQLDRWGQDAVVLDAPTSERGGAGRVFDWQFAMLARARFPALPQVLAAGLHADNVGALIALAAPWAVDVASGVESAPGLKDRDKLRAFVSAVRQADSPAGSAR